MTTKKPIGWEGESQRHREAHYKGLAVTKYRKRVKIKVEPRHMYLPNGRYGENPNELETIIYDFSSKRPNDNLQIHNQIIKIIKRHNLVSITMSEYGSIFAQMKWLQVIHIHKDLRRLKIYDELKRAIKEYNSSTNPS
jgi:hypothetical protein